MVFFAIVSTFLGIEILRFVLYARRERRMSFRETLGTFWWVGGTALTIPCFLWADAAGVSRDMPLGTAAFGTIVLLVIWAVGAFAGRPSN
jgi:hypothetical protein